MFLDVLVDVRLSLWVLAEPIEVDSQQANPQDAFLKIDETRVGQFHRDCGCRREIGESSRPDSLRLPNDFLRLGTGRCRFDNGMLVDSEFGSGCGLLVSCRLLRD